jgi:hypothetical protein
LSDQKYATSDSQLAREKVRALTEAIEEGRPVEETPVAVEAVVDPDKTPPGGPPLSIVRKKDEAP